jgi:hypothetical protein
MAFEVGLGPDIWSDNYILSQIYNIKRGRGVRKENSDQTAGLQRTEPATASIKIRADTGYAIGR